MKWKIDSINSSIRSRITWINKLWGYSIRVSDKKENQIFRDQSISKEIQIL